MRKFFFTLLTLVLFLAAALILFMQTSRFQNFAYQMGISYLQERGIEVQTEGFFFSFPFRIVADRLQANVNGTHIEAEELAVTLSPVSLFAKDLDVANISAKSVTVQTKGTNQPFELPSIGIVVQHIAIADFQYNDMALPITGHFLLNPRLPLIAGNLIFGKKGEFLTSTQVIVQSSKKENTFVIEVKIHEPENGLLQGLVFGNAAIQLSADLQDWQTGHFFSTLQIDYELNGIPLAHEGVLKANLHLDDALILSSVTLTGDHIEAEGEATIYSDFRFQGLAELKAKLPFGSVDLSLQAQGTLDRPEGEFFAKSDALVFHDQTIRDAEAEGTFSVQERAATGQLLARGFYGELEIPIAFSFYANEEEISIHDFSSSLTGGKITGDFVDEQIRLQAEGVQLYPLSSFLGEPISGIASFELAIDKQLYSLKFLAEEMKIRELTLGDFKLDANNEGISLQIEGENLTLLAKGRLDGQSARITTFSGNLAGQEILLSEPIFFSLEQNRYVVEIPSIAIGGGTLQATVTQDDALSFKYSIDSLPLEFLALIDPAFPIEGTLSSSASIDLHQKDLSGTIELRGENLIFEDSRAASLPPLNFLLRGEVKNSAIQLFGTLDGLMPSPIQVDAKLPVRITDAPFPVQIATESPLSVRFKAQGPLEPLLDLIGSDTINVSGEVDMSVEVQGTIADPRIIGDAHLREGSLENADTGTLFTHIEADVEANGKTVTLKSLSALDGVKGRALGSGSLTLDPAQNFPFKITAALKEMLLVNLDMVQATASGDVIFSGNLYGGHLAGDIAIDRIMILLPDESQDIPDPIEVTYINQRQVERLPTYYVRPESLWPIELDLSVTAENNIFARKQDLATEWRGKVTVKGTDEKPLLFGECKIIEGELKLNGKPFDLDKGTITFGGDLEKKTSLYLIASQEVDRYKIDLILKGPLDNPVLSLRSNPPLPQQEIISWLLFGKGISEVTPIQGQQVTETYTDIASQAKNPDALSRFRSAFGIDRLEFSRKGVGEDEDVNVQVGKYITRNLYLGVNKNLGAVTGESFTDGYQVSIQANIIKNIKLEAEVGRNDDTQLFLKWQRDY